MASGDLFCCETDAAGTPGSFNSGTKGQGELFDLFINATLYLPGQQITFFSAADPSHCRRNAGTQGRLWVISSSNNNCTAATSYNECIDLTNQGMPGGRIPTSGACVWCGAGSLDQNDGTCFEPYWSGVDSCPDNSIGTFQQVAPNYECPAGTVRLGCQSFPVDSNRRPHVKGADPMMCASTSGASGIAAMASAALLLLLLLL